MYFWQKLGTKCVTKCKPQGPSVYFGNLGTKSKILVTLLFFISFMYQEGEMVELSLQILIN
ncbi:hypothetical protein HanRHA438_Chr06g0248311 [Helianthus annuus]|nr:hypothetical protein HanRHA438_Chr06g0248311 [Helianthus annuus]